jgi:hypothetical protein
LLVAGVFANDPNDALAADQLALLADTSNAGSHLHDNTCACKRAAHPVNVQNRIAGMSDKGMMNFSEDVKGLINVSSLRNP